MLLIFDVGWARPALKNLVYLWFNTSFNSTKGYALSLIFFGALSPFITYVFALLTQLNIDYIHALISMAKPRSSDQ